MRVGRNNLLSCQLLVIVLAIINVVHVFRLNVDSAQPTNKLRFFDQEETPGIDSNSPVSRNIMAGGVDTVGAGGPSFIAGHDNAPNPIVLVPPEDVEAQAEKGAGRKNSLHVGLTFTSGGSCEREKVSRVWKSWDRLVHSLQNALLERPKWHLTVRFVNDALPCIDLTDQRRQPLVDAGGDRVILHYVNNSEPMGIGRNMKESFSWLHADATTLAGGRPVDLFTNVEDDISVSPHWLTHLEMLYAANKLKTDVPLIASGYNSNNTGILPAGHPCRWGHGDMACSWKTLAYGPNYLFDRATYDSVVRSAFSPSYRAYNGKRPLWTSSTNAWDQWVIDEYFEVLRSDFAPPVGYGFLVTNRSLLEHHQLASGMHAKAGPDMAVDWVGAEETETKDVAKEKSMLRKLM